MKPINLKITRYIHICLGFLCLIFATAPIVRADTAPLITAYISTGIGIVHHFQLELAETPERRAEGLMYRKFLPADGGMLFVWPNTDLRLFWMRNTPLSLDILFFDKAGKLVYLHPKAVPFSQATISSIWPAKYVVEIHAKTAERLGFDTKSTLSFSGPLPAAR